MGISGTLVMAVRCPAIITLANDSLYGASKYHKDRLAYVNPFPLAINSAGLPAEIAVPLPSILLNDELQMAHAPIGSKENYAYWLMKYCVCSPKWINAASKALDKFLLALETNLKMANLPKVLSVRVRLLEMQEESSVSQRL